MYNDRDDRGLFAPAIIAATYIAYYINAKDKKDLNS